MVKKSIPKKSDDIADWYTKVILAADLADYGPAKGTMIFKPYGYAIWEQVRAAMDPLIKAKGVENAYFPLLIPTALLEREKAHVEGFSPELAVVTHGGGEKLAESLAVRPTSETIMYEAYARWIQSWRDLPMQINQWNNVVRWEKRTYLFMRTSEFLWQEGHTAHASHEEAQAMQRWAMEMYTQIYRDHFALFGYAGYKSQTERFAGADSSMTYEMLMPSGKSLQAATSHDLGQNFAKPFGIKFQTKGGGEDYVWQTSWGLSTRSIGAVILAHGDDNGLRLPPKLAPVQAVILPVQPIPQLLKYADELAKQLADGGVRVQVDATDDETIGYRINKWELKGAPLRLEVGEREVAAKQVTVARRDTGDKSVTPVAKLNAEVARLLEAIQANLLKESQEFTEANTRSAKDLADFKKIMKGHKGFIRVPWNDDPKVEEEIQKATKATSSCQPLDSSPIKGKDFYTGKDATIEWLFAQAY
ncbi:proline--tRNA ligase [Candidatus Microgenomates bacterium]|nr:proline--tRNA ligase [Candidatus Microgenomates bacterium]